MRNYQIFISIALSAIIILPGLSQANGVEFGLPYPGITLPQHALAQESLRAFFMQHWDQAESLSVEMQRMERENGFLPMSAMLRYAMRSWRILNDEFEHEAEREKACLELEPLRTECMNILHHRAWPDSTLATRLFLEGGINGFNAVLKIRSSPLKALSSGIKSIKMFNTAHALAPKMNDVYLGLGLFQCALAEEPGIVKVAIRLFHGLHVNLDSGLIYLRICSDSALYTQDGAREYLVQFLDPKKPFESAEKQKIFRTLQRLYPGSPYYVFQEIDEGLAFHRYDIFSDSTIAWAKGKMETFDTSNYSLRRYADLVRWQCAYLDTSPVDTLHLEAFTGGRDYSFYPIFLRAARADFLLHTRKNLSNARRKEERQNYTRLKKQALYVVRHSMIDPMLRGYFLWHLQDGLP
jgi:hypothetical protein